MINFTVYMVVPYIFSMIVLYVLVRLARYTLVLFGLL